MEIGNPSELMLIKLSECKYLRSMIIRGGDIRVNRDTLKCFNNLIRLELHDVSIYGHYPLRNEWAGLKESN